jgi:hypothetical protein
MQDDVSRLVGIEGLVVTGVDEVGACLLLGVELVAGAGCCRWCGRASFAVKERPVVRVRDLPIAGRPTYLLWRKRRFGCQACGRTFTETHPQLPARQRVSARFRARLFEHCREGAAHAEVAREEHTTRYQVARASPTAARCCWRRASGDRRGGCRSMRPRTGAGTSSRRWSLTWTAAASSTSSTAAAAAPCSAGCRRSRRLTGGRSRSSRSTPMTLTGKPSGLNCRTLGSSSTTSTWSAAPTPRWTPCAASANEASGGDGRRAPAAAATRRAGDPSSTTPATVCSGRANGSPNATGDGSPSYSPTSH